MLIVLLAFLIFLLRYFPKNSVAFYFVILYSVSLSMNFLIGTDLGIVSQSDIFYVLWTGAVLFLIISPWKKITGINRFSSINSVKIDRFSYIVGSLCVFMTLGCLLIYGVLYSVVDDINIFKYKEGAQQDVYSSLGVSMLPYMLAYVFYPLSYLFVPLIFYYYSQKRIKMMIWCVVSSFSSVAFGLAYFSRAHSTTYVMLLILSYLMYRNLFSTKTRKRVVKYGIIAVLLYSLSFITISNNRFEGHDYDRQKSEAAIQNTVAYSMADYFGMWWYAGRDVFERYNYQGFNGKIAFQGIDRAAHTLSRGLIPSYSESLLKQRELLLKEYSGSFIGVSAYFLYDLGVFFSVIVLLGYNLFVTRKIPKNGVISVERSMLLTIFVLLPLFGVFYSTLDVMILLLFYFFFIKLFIFR